MVYKCGRGGVINRSMPARYGVRGGRPQAASPSRQTSAFYGQRILAWAATLLGCRCCLISRSRRSRFGSNRCYRFGLAAHADGWRQAGWIKRCGRIVALTLNPGATFRAWTQAARWTGVAHKRIVVRIDDGLAFAGRHAFAGQCRHFGNLRFGITFARAIKAAVLAGPVFTWSAIFARGTLFARLPLVPWPVIALPVLTGPIFAGPIITLAVTTWTVIARPIVTLAVLPWAFFAIITGPVITGPVITGPLFTRFTFLARWRAFIRGVIAFCAEFIVLFLAVLFLPAFAVGAQGAGALVFGADTAIGDHAEVVIGKLQIVFGLHTVTVEVRV